MTTVCHATIIGYLNKPIEIRHDQKNKPQAHFTLVTQKTWNDPATGEPKSASSWHPVVVINPETIKDLQANAKRDCLIYAEGEIKQRKSKSPNGLSENSYYEIQVGYFDKCVALKECSLASDLPKPSVSANNAHTGYIDDEVPF